MTYKPKCSVVGCSKVASYVDTGGKPFCEVHAVRAQGIEYGGQEPKFERIDKDLLKLEAELRSFVPLVSDDPEAVHSLSRDAVMAYFTEIGRPDIAELFYKTNCWG